MIKRVFSLLMCLLLICAQLPAAHAEKAELSIASAEDFMAFAENCRLDSYSRGLSVSLAADIDLSGEDFFPVPSFSGSFDGMGHSIKGINFDADGSVQGLFRYICSGAVVKNLNVIGSISPGGSRVCIGGIAGSNSGTIVNCSFDGSISGGDKVGGIAGENRPGGIIEGCISRGAVSGLHFAGGICGENNGVIRKSENYAPINTSEQENLVDISDISLESLAGSEFAATVTDIGGICGLSHGLIRSCINYGAVGYKSMGYNIGGIVGSQSGYVADCENRAGILGRKEVGGIAGQLEPAANVDYDTDTLQILQTQLDAMGGTVNQASAEVQSAGNQLGKQVNELEEPLDTAMEAAKILSDRENLDPDSLLAAQNALTASLGEIGTGVQAMGTTAANSMSAIGGTLSALQGQMNAMSNTIGNAGDNLGVEISDISDKDTEDNLTAKIEKCANFASVSADSNAGGIAGAISVPNDFDNEDNLSFTGESSLNFESELRAVILKCENYGSITAKKQNGGGITGLQSMGLVRSCINEGSAGGENAEYVGGISGLSRGFIRKCSANCIVEGDSYVGGIAGSATIASDCISLVRIEGVREKCGEILGIREDCDEENPVRGNIYLSTARDMGAIDGISYDKQAQPVSFDDFMAHSRVPEDFKSVDIRFVFDDGSEQLVNLPLGSALSEIPEIPEKENFSSRWDGLSEAKLDNILFDMSFEAVYTSEGAVIESSLQRESGLPLLLLQGSFSSGAELILSESPYAPETELGERIAEVWDFAISEGESISGGRFLLPADCVESNARLMLMDEGGSWRDVEATLHGSYLVFETDGDFSAICLKMVPYSLFNILSQAGSISLISIFVLVICLAVFAIKQINGASRQKEEQ